MSSRAGLRLGTWLETHIALSRHGGVPRSCCPHSIRVAQ